MRAELEAHVHFHREMILEMIKLYRQLSAPVELAYREMVCSENSVNS